ncbi:hypothetical protein ABK040_000717 [Willaertia magna]
MINVKKVNTWFTSLSSLTDFWRFISFSWVYPLVQIGVKRPLQEEDLLHIPNDLRYKNVLVEFQRIYKTVAPKTFRQFILVIFHYMWKSCLILALIGLLSKISILCYILIFQNLLVSVEDLSDDYGIGTVLSTIAPQCFLLFVFRSLMQLAYCNQFQYGLNIGSKLRSSLSQEVYLKSLRLNASSKQKYTTGAIMNIATTDTNRINWLPYNTLYALFSIVHIAFSFYLCYDLLGTSAIYGFSTILFIMPINYFVGKKAEKYEDELETLQDGRTEIISQMVSSMRFCKLYTLEKLFHKKVMDIRQEEEHKILIRNLLYGIFGIAWHMLPGLLPFFAFYHYCYILGNSLSMSLSFSVLNIVHQMRFAIADLPETTIGVIRDGTSLNRIFEYLSTEEIDNNQFDEILDSDNHKLNIKFDNASFEWEENRPVLQNINLEIKSGEFVCVIGRVGQGKSSLLSSLLGELKKIDGKAYKKRDLTFSYISQESWIRSETVRENILFGNEYDREKYLKVIHACNLEPDFVNFLNSDLTVVGEKGINLSGGQKSRVSLARCFYSDSDIYLLDDPLSAVDVHTGEHILNHGLLGILNNKTRILVTNHIHFIEKADKIVVIDNGKIIQQGSYSQLYNDVNNQTFKKLIQEFIEKEKKEQIETDDHAIDEKVKTIIDFEPMPFDKEEIAKTSLIEEEEREVGALAITKLLKFILTGNKATLIMVFLLSVGAYSSRTGYQYITTLWSEDKDYKNHSLNWYLTTFLISSSFVWILDYVTHILTVNHFLKIAKTYHENLLNSIVKATITFFDKTPIGRIITRFTRDTNIIDNELQWKLSEIIGGGLVNVVGGIIFISFVAPYTLLIIPLFVFILYKWQLVYRSCTRELKRLESIAGSPTNSHFSETLSGLQTIRAYKGENRLYNEFINKSEKELTIFYNLESTSRYFDINSDVISSIFISLVSLISCLSMNKEMTGILLSQGTLIFDYLFWILYLYSVTEKQFISVERIEQYSQLESEKYEPTTTTITATTNTTSCLEEEELVDEDNWPKEGGIRMENVYMKYQTKKDNNLVLHGITANIKAKERIGIVGRTGAGKTSLISVLFRIQEMEEYSGGIFIDNVDIRNIPLIKLRSKMSIIPQQPTLFKGTLRENLDPYNQFSDRDIWLALERVNLKEKIMEEQDGILMNVAENGDNFSAGTRQLFCLARALLRQSKILILDEATSYCDLETDKQIQITLRNEFINCTILCIAHRLETVMDYDRILVLENGKVKEFDTPQHLLNDKQSLFYSMVEQNKRK